MPVSTTFHRDWRDLISEKLRVKIKREQARGPSRPYLGRSLDKFERFVPHLFLEDETVFQLEDVCTLVNAPGDEELWTPGSASKFLHYLAAVGVITIRQAGRTGNAYTLCHDYAVAPNRSRQSGSGQISRPEPQPEGDKEEVNITVIPREVEFENMPTAPLPEITACYAPESVKDPEDVVELESAAMLAAIDRITENLGTISLNFRTELTGEAGVTAYRAQDEISKAMADLQRLRSAVSRGDGTPLQEILDRD